MDIRQIRNAKDVAEQAVIEAFKTFRETTGLSVVACNIETYKMQTVDGLNVQPVPYSVVRLKIEDI